MKMKPYKEYKETDLRWLNEIPSHWEVKRGKSLFKREERPVREKDEVVTCFRDGEVTLRRNRRLDGFTESIKEIGYQGIRKGDLVIHQMDAFAGAVGVSDSDGKSTPVYSVCNGMVDLNNYYYAFIIREIARNGYIKSLSRGIRERSTDFRFSTFGKEFYPLPPKEEQDKIVAFLDNKLGKIDRFIDLKTRQIELLKEQKEAMINKAVTKGLDDNVAIKDSGIEEVGEIPEYWKILSLKRVTKNVKTGSTPSDFKEKHLSDFGLNWYSPGDFKDDVILGSATRKLSKIGQEGVNLFPGGSVLIVGIGGTLGKVGISEKEFTCNQQINTIVVNNDIINNYYLLYYLKIIKDYLIKTVNHTTLPILNQNETKNIKVILPKLNIQTKIVDFIQFESKKIDKTVNLYKEEIDLIKEYKTSLISSVVTGKIDVREA